MQIKQPDNMDKNDFARGVSQIHRETGAMTRRPESRRNEDGSKYLVVEWDESVSPAPNQGQITQALARADKERLKRVAMDEALKRMQNSAAASVLSDIDNGTIRDESGVRNSDKYVP